MRSSNSQCVVVAMSLAVMACHEDHPTGPDASVRTAEVMVHPAAGAVVPVPNASATAVTNHDGAALRLVTTNLMPGHAYTAWLLIMNEPGNCSATPCTPADILGNSDGIKADVTWLAGLVAGPDGKGTFAGELREGPIPDGWLGNGFTNAEGAEMHIVLNDHGPVIAGLESEMTSTYRAGCTDESLPPPFPEKAKADGTPGPNACLLYQVAIFGGGIHLE